MCVCICRGWGRGESMPMHMQKPEVRGRLQVPCSLLHSSQKLELGWLSERFSYLPASASTPSAGVGGMCVVMVQCIPGCLGFKCRSACLCSKCSYTLSPFPVSGDNSLPIRELRQSGSLHGKKQEPCMYHFQPVSLLIQPCTIYTEGII